MIEMKLPQQFSILVVDDEESLRDTFQFFLSNEGYSPVITAATFEEAVDAVAEQAFDLIISDIVLKGFSGVDFLKHIRSKNINCPVVMVTGYPNVETAAEAVRLGAFDYIPKPVEKDALLKTTRLALQQQQLEKAKIRAEKEQERYRKYLQTIFHSVTDAIITTDMQLQINEMNPAALALFNEIFPGLSESELKAVIGTRVEFNTIKDDLNKVMTNMDEMIRHRLEFKTPDHLLKVLSVRMSPLNDGQDKISGMVMVIRDVSNPKSKNIAPRIRFHGFLGKSRPMQAAYTMMENVGRVDLSVLITGESGTGKELAAEALHLESRRKERSLIKVDCTAIPENLLESELFGHRKGSFTGADRDRMGRILQADGGTLFLDEIGDISQMMQLRLLRFLQESTFYPVGRDTPIHVDVRVIAATNVDLKQKVRQGEFREDLYFRLRVIDIMLPPLRERGSDIGLLATHFITSIAPKVGKSINGISNQALDLMNSYSWPGNVRELKHVMERACVLCNGPSISTSELPREVVQCKQQLNRPEPERLLSPTLPIAKSPFPGDENLPMADRILLALERTGGNKAKAARLLKIDRTTLYRKIKSLNLDIPDLNM